MKSAVAVAVGPELGPVAVRRLGLRDYEETLAIQEEARAQVIAGGPEQLLLVEHPPVITLGRRGDARHVLVPRAPVLRVSRGGDVTYHGPGQLVGYPILDLGRRGRDIDRYLRALEEVLIAVARRFGLVARRQRGFTGVWLGNAKLAAIGVGIRRWVTMHGFALNVADLRDDFAAIVPCGLAGIGVTSLAQATGQCPAMADVEALVIDEFQRVFATLDVGAATGGALGVIARRHPEWIKARAPTGRGVAETRRIVRELGLHTVCEEAQCPNLGECWSHHTATVMLLGDTCTRNCRFCAVSHGKPLIVDAEEPGRVAEAVARLGLRHVVMTSVNRDDLPDGGAGHFAATAAAVHARVPECTIEVLIPDLQGDHAALATVVAAPIAILNHNTETVPRLYKRVRPGAIYERSLGILSAAKRLRPGLRTKTGLMLGLGETHDEILMVLADLRAVGCDVLTLGQYLRPSLNELPVERYVTPDEFAELGNEARALGFAYVESGPLVRSSYHAWEHLP